MKRIIVVACVVLGGAGCQSAGTSATVPAPGDMTDEVPAGTPIDQMPLPQGEFSFAGGDGATLDTAVVVKALDENVGVAALYGWIGQKYPGARAAGQTTVIQKGRFYDAIDIVTGSNERRTLYFDVTSFFGKF